MELFQELVPFTPCTSHSMNIISHKPNGVPSLAKKFLTLFDQAVTTVRNAIIKLCCFDAYEIIPHPTHATS